MSLLVSLQLHSNEISYGFRVSLESSFRTEPCKSSWVEEDSARQEMITDRPHWLDNLTHPPTHFPLRVTSESVSRTEPVFVPTSVSRTGFAVHDAAYSCQLAGPFNRGILRLF